MNCTDCTATREAPAWPMHNPTCLYCGATLIQRIGKYSIPISAATERRRAVLDDWVAHGHDEAQIRRLAKGPLAIEPTKAGRA